MLIVTEPKDYFTIAGVVVTIATTAVAVARYANRWRRDRKANRWTVRWLSNDDDALREQCVKIWDVAGIPEHERLSADHLKLCSLHTTAELKRARKSGEQPRWIDFPLITSRRLEGKMTFGAAAYGTYGRRHNLLFLALLGQDKSVGLQGAADESTDSSAKTLYNELHRILGGGSPLPRAPDAIVFELDDPAFPPDGINDHERAAWVRRARGRRRVFASELKSRGLNAYQIALPYIQPSLDTDWQSKTQQMSLCIALSATMPENSGLGAAFARRIVDFVYLFIYASVEGDPDHTPAAYGVKLRELHAQVVGAIPASDERVTLIELGSDLPPGFRALSQPTDPKRAGR